LTVDVVMDIKYAIRILTRFQLSRALVTERGDMVGIVTLRDMAIRATFPESTDEPSES
jgi:CBS domain-containing protein